MYSNTIKRSAPRPTSTNSHLDDVIQSYERAEKRVQDQIDDPTVSYDIKCKHIKTLGMLRLNKPVRPGSMMHYLAPESPRPVLKPVAPRVPAPVSRKTQKRPASPTLYERYDNAEASLKAQLKNPHVAYDVKCRIIGDLNRLRRQKPVPPGYMMRFLAD